MASGSLGRTGSLSFLRGRRLPVPVLFTIPAIAFVIYFAVVPLVQFAWGSVWVRGAFSWQNYLDLINSDYFGTVLVRTVLTSLAVTVICVIVGYPLAYFLHRTRGRAKIILLALVVLPYLTSVLVRVFAWAALLRLHGPINQALVWLGIFDTPQQLAHSFTGTVIGLVHVLSPLAILAMWARMSRIERGHELTAGALGASPSRVFMTVFLPLSMPGVLAGGLIVYVMSLGAYVIPAALGSTNGLLFAQVVADQATVALNWSMAGAMTVAMLIAGVIPFVLFKLLQSIAGRFHSQYPARHRFGSSVFAPIVDLVPTTVWRVVSRIWAILVLVFLVAPEVVVLLFSFGPVHQLNLPPEYWTLQGYRNFLDDPRWTSAFGRSFGYGAVDALIAVVLGGLAAYGLARSKGKFFAIGLGIIVLPLGLPEIVPALSFYVFANKMGIAATAPGVILGQAVTAIGLMTLIASTVIRNVDVNIEYASQMSGASKIRTVLRIVVPLAAPGFIVGGLYAFLNALDNLVMPLFIAGLHVTVPVRMFFSMQDELNSVIAVVAALLIGMLLLATAIAVAIMSRARVQINVADVAGR